MSNSWWFDSKVYRRDGEATRCKEFPVCYRMPPEVLPRAAAALGKPRRIQAQWTVFFTCQTDRLCVSGGGKKLSRVGEEKKRGCRL